MTASTVTRKNPSRAVNNAKHGRPPTEAASGSRVVAGSQIVTASSELHPQEWQQARLFQVTTEPPSQPRLRRTVKRAAAAQSSAAAGCRADAAAQEPRSFK